jgi:hypothetical protein
MNSLPDSRPAATPQRFDLYGPIHKALRLAMNDAVRQLGRADPEDAGELHAALAQAEGLLALARSHLEHENRFVHPQLEARVVGSCAALGTEHAEHVEAIEALHDQIDDLRAAPAAERAQRMHLLYRRMAVFCAESQLHMEREESEHTTALWRACSDEELLGLDRRIQAQLPPAEMQAWLRWIAGSAPVPFLAAMLTDMRGALPPQALDPVIGLVRSELDERRWRRLCARLCLAPDAVALPG